MQAFKLSCEFMYTGAIELVEDAEVAINLWMMAGVLQIANQTAYAIRHVNALLTKTPLEFVPALVTAAISAWQLGERLGGNMASEGYQMLKSVMDFVLCDLQARCTPDTAASYS